MKVNVNDIPFEGIKVSGTISQSLIDARDDDNLHFVAPLEVEANLEKLEDTVIAKTKIHSKISGTCCRCLKEVEKDWDRNFVLDLEVEPKSTHVDLDEEVRQEVIMSFPARVLCKEDCRGLCMDCGVNLNDGECKCSKN